MFVREYTLRTSFTHSVEDRPELVDKGCLMPHTHEVASIKFGVQSNLWVDFKEIKKAANNAMKVLCHPESIKFSEDGSEILSADLGKMDTETIIDELITLMKVEFVKIDPKAKMSIWVQETLKYGIGRQEE